MSKDFQPATLENVNHEQIESVFNTLVGQSMELIEAIGLSEKQEKAFKAQLKRLIYTSLDDVFNIEFDVDSTSYAGIHDNVNNS
jgi:hypothetical protein